MDRIMQGRKSSKLGLLVVCACVVWCLSAVAGAQAAPVSVGCADSSGTDSSGHNANALAMAISGATGGDVVTLAPNCFYALNKIGKDPAITITQNLTIDGNGSTVDGGGSVGLFEIDANVTVENLIAQHGSAVLGGAFFVGQGPSLTIMGSTVQNNQSDQGGGIYGAGSVNVNTSTFAGNSAGSGGGAYFLADFAVSNSTFNGGNKACSGSAIFDVSSALGSGNTSVVNTTFTGNSFGPPSGSGLLCARPTRSTIGSVIDAVDNQKLTLSNVTDSGNQVTGLEVDASGTIDSHNVIDTHNTGVVTGTAIDPNASDCANNGGMFTGNTNLSDNPQSNPSAATTPVSTDGCDPAVFKSGDANLQTLGSNGGPTMTMALLAPSDALGTGDPNVCASLGNLDQRMFPRVNDLAPFTNCDIGAYELQGTPPTASTLITATPTATTIRAGAVKGVKRTAVKGVANSGRAQCVDPMTHSTVIAFNGRRVTTVSFTIDGKPLPAITARKALKFTPSTRFHTFRERLDLSGVNTAGKVLRVKVNFARGAAKVFHINLVGCITKFTG